jgi:arylsulfatase A-like enzyme
LSSTVLGAVLFTALYAVITAQQFTRYAYPAGMDLTIGGVVAQEAVGILVEALWPVIVKVNAILLGFHVAVGALLGFLAGRFWDLVCRRLDCQLSPRRRTALVAVSLVVVAGLAFSTVVVRYPFQYDHFLNARRGFLRWVQSALTSHADPGLLELATWATIATLALPWLVRVVRSLVGYRPAFAALVSIAVLGMGGPNTAPPVAGANAGPNIVLILLESARSDLFSVNGHPWPTSPNIDRLVAESGMSFTNAWSHSNGTVESVVTIMTSTYAQRHGVRSMFHSEDFARPGLPRLPDLLRQHGYATRVATDWDGDVTYFNEGTLPGFDRYDVAEFGVVNYVKQIYGQYFLFFALTDNALGHRLFSTFYHAGGGFAPAGSDAYYRARIAEHLGELATTPRFFLTLFFSNAHMNYRCPYPYYRRFTDPGYAGPNKYQALSHVLHKEPNGLEQDRRQITALYAGCIATLDDNIGFVADTLRSLGVADRTILVITGDHGEKLPDDRTFWYGRNGAWLDPAEFHVPLMVVAPQLATAPRTVASAVRHVDIMPTILDLAALPIPADIQGMSLMPLMTGAASDVELEVFGEAGFHWVPVERPYRGYRPMTHVVQLRRNPGGTLIPRYFLRPECLARMEEAKPRFVRAGPYQLNYRPLVAGARVELYDVHADPAGQRNLADARPDVVERLRSRLFSWSLEDSALTVRAGHLVARDENIAVECAPEKFPDLTRK